MWALARFSSNEKSVWKKNFRKTLTLKRNLVIISLIHRNVTVTSRIKDRGILYAKEVFLCSTAKLTHVLLHLYERVLRKREHQAVLHCITKHHMTFAFCVNRNAIKYEYVLCSVSVRAHFSVMRSFSNFLNPLTTGRLCHVRVLRYCIFIVLHKCIGTALLFASFDNVRFSTLDSGHSSRLVQCHF